MRAVKADLWDLASGLLLKMVADLCLWGLRGILNGAQRAAQRREVLVALSAVTNRAHRSSAAPFWGRKSCFA